MAVRQVAGYRAYSRASYVEFATDMKVRTLIDCHQPAFEALNGVARRLLYDNMKAVVLERDVDGPGEHRSHAGFLDCANPCGLRPLTGLGQVINTDRRLPK